MLPTDEMIECAAQALWEFVPIGRDSCFLSVMSF